jgi:hypothetical protein
MLFELASISDACNRTFARHSAFLRRHSLWALSHCLIHICQLHQTNAMLLASTSAFIVKAVTTIKAFLNIQDVIIYFKSSFSNSVHRLTYCSNVTLEIWIITVRTSVFNWQYFLRLSKPGLNVKTLHIYAIVSDVYYRNNTHEYFTHF